MSAITRKYLEKSVKRLNELTGYHQADYDCGEMGRYLIYEAYCGYALYQICSKGGGVRAISRHMCGTKRELYDFIMAYTDGIEAGFNIAGVNDADHCGELS